MINRKGSIVPVFERYSISEFAIGHFCNSDGDPGQEVHCGLYITTDEGKKFAFSLPFYGLREIATALLGMANEYEDD